MSGRPRMCLGLALLVLASGTACGLKRPPRPPAAETPPPVAGMAGEWQGTEAVLTGRVAEERVFRKWIARVYHARFAEGRAPCMGCPVDYGGYQEAVPEWTGRETFALRVSVEAEAGIHVFEIRLAGPEGAVGPRSERIRMARDARAPAEAR